MGEAKSSGPTIDQVLDEFLSEQETRLSVRTYRTYQSVIGLLRQCLEDYTLPVDPALAEAVEEARQARNEHAVCSLCPPQEIMYGLREFLGWFLVRKVLAGQDFMKTAGSVTRRLVKWLDEHHYVDIGTVGEDHIKELSEGLPKATRMRDQLDKWVRSRSRPRLSGTYQSHFQIVAITEGGWQIKAVLGDLSGEVAVPAKIRDSAQINWEVSGVVGRTADGLCWVEVWNVYP